MSDVNFDRSRHPLSSEEIDVVRAIAEKARVGEWGNNAWIVRGWRFNVATTPDPRRGRTRWKFTAAPFPAVARASDVAWKNLGQILAAFGVPLDCLGWWVPTEMPFVVEWDVVVD